MQPSAAHREARLSARPRADVDTLPAGLHPLALDPARDSYLYVPESARGQAAPAVLMLHGAGGHAHHGLAVLRELADAHGVILIAPASRSSTWDVIRGGYGPDVALIDRALSTAFERCAVDPARFAIGGFSDGASYALSLGITNGDLFTHILAFSPGFIAAADAQDAPSVFVSHGTDDRVLPIDRCSRVLVPKLERAGYEVRYREFEGGHVVPPGLADEAVAWLAGGEGVSCRAERSRFDA
jgi:phospholipase/carboxylesterase